MNDKGRRICGAPRRDGAPCGRVVLGQDGRCAAHTTLAPGEWVSASGGGQPDKAAREMRRAVAATPVVVEIEADLADSSREGSGRVVGGGFRERLEKQTDEAWASIEQTLRETIKSATRQEYVGCPSCGQRFPIVRRDYGAALRAVELMLDRVVAKKTPASEATDSGRFEDVTQDQIADMSADELSAYLRWHYARHPEWLMRKVEELRSFREYFALRGTDGIVEHGARTAMAGSEGRLRELYEALKKIFEASHTPND